MTSTANAHALSKPRRPTQLASQHVTHRGVLPRQYPCAALQHCRQQHEEAAPLPRSEGRHRFEASKVELAASHATGDHHRLIARQHLQPAATKQRSVAVNERTASDTAHGRSAAAAKGRTFERNLKPRQPATPSLQQMTRGTSSRSAWAASRTPAETSQDTAVSTTGKKQEHTSEPACNAATPCRADCKTHQMHGIPWCPSKDVEVRAHERFVPRIAERAAYEGVVLAVHERPSASLERRLSSGRCEIRDVG